jgi:hypothetical protein
VVVASGLSSGSVNCICIFTGTSMAGLSSAVHITATLDPVIPSGLTGSLIRVTETGPKTAGGKNLDLERTLTFSYLILVQCH